ncbi:hypothetical protein [Prochlorothrix hollandica]|uniref:hypothetical protein n=1 Tax=Prochlorothrix hollandica TaxID=1223 RepID=UPI0009D9A1AF
MLLDEGIDRRFAKELIKHEVRTAPQMGWAGIKNGERLTRASVEFDVFITVDRNLQFQQNLSQFNMVIIVLKASTNRLIDLKPLAPKILSILDTANRGQATIVS